MGCGDFRIANTIYAVRKPHHQIKEAAKCLAASFYVQKIISISSMVNTSWQGSSTLF